jgi:hypothetical protein
MEEEAGDGEDEGGEAISDVISLRGIALL